MQKKSKADQVMVREIILFHYFERHGLSSSGDFNKNVRPNVQSALLEKKCHMIFFFIPTKSWFNTILCSPFLLEIFEKRVQCRDTFIKKTV